MVGIMKTRDLVAGLAALAFGMVTTRPAAAFCLFGWCTTSKEAIERDQARWQAGKKDFETWASHAANARAAAEQARRMLGLLEASAVRLDAKAADLEAASLAKEQQAVSFDGLASTFASSGLQHRSRLGDEKMAYQEALSHLRTAVVQLEAVSLRSDQEQIRLAQAKVQSETAKVKAARHEYMVTLEVMRSLNDGVVSAQTDAATLRAQAEQHLVEAERTREQAEGARTDAGVQAWRARREDTKADRYDRRADGAGARGLIALERMLRLQDEALVGELPDSPYFIENQYPPIPLMP